MNRLAAATVEHAALLGTDLVARFSEQRPAEKADGLGITGYENGPLARAI